MKYLALALCIIVLITVNLIYPYFFYSGICWEEGGSFNVISCSSLMAKNALYFCMAIYFFEAIIIVFGPPIFLMSYANTPANLNAEMDRLDEKLEELEDRLTTLKK